jgi:hypothetical protein
MFALIAARKKSERHLTVRIAARLWIWRLAPMKIIECEICGSYALEKYKPLNNICLICKSIGSLFINDNPSEEQLAEVVEQDET